MSVLAEHPPASDALRTIHDRYRPGIPVGTVKSRSFHVGRAPRARLEG